MTKTVAINSRDKNILRSELWPPSSDGRVSTIKTPVIPNTIDAQINIRVAIFCILVV